MTSARPSLAIVEIAHLVTGRAWDRKRDFEEMLSRELGWTSDWHSYRGLAWDTVVVVTPRVAPSSFGAFGRAVHASNTIVIADARNLGDIDYDAEQRAADDVAIAASLGVAPALDWDGTPESTRAVCALIRAETERCARAEAATSRPTERTRPAEASSLAPLSTRFASGPWRPLTVDDALVSSLANRCCLRGGRPLVFGDAPGVALDVLAGSVIPAPELPPWSAISTDGTRFLRRGDDPRVRTTVELVDADTRAVLASSPASGLPFSFADGWAGIGWRCTFTWLRAAHDALAVVAGCAHDWPLGHAKKQLGFRDNQPCALAVAPDAGAYVSRFERDALVAATVPLAWRRFGPAAVLDWPPEDTLRRVFFVPDWHNLAGQAASPAAALDEDAREAAPALVVGPDDHLRYALDLSRETWAVIAEGRAERVGGPDDGFLVCDATHAIVRRSSGRLLCGTARTLYAHDDGALVREDFVTGAREEVGRESEPVHMALAFPGADNALLVGPPTERDDGTTFVRVRLI